MSLLCFWAFRELGMSLTDLARHLGISVLGVPLYPLYIIFGIKRSPEGVIYLYENRKK